MSVNFHPSIFLNWIVINQLTGSSTKFHYMLKQFAMATEFDVGFGDVLEWHDEHVDEQQLEANGI
jgi:hypothetical protein